MVIIYIYKFIKSFEFSSPGGKSVRERVRSMLFKVFILVEVRVSNVLVSLECDQLEGLFKVSMFIKFRGSK